MRSNRFPFIAIILAMVLMFGIWVTACYTGCTRHSDCVNGLICGPLSTCIVPPDLSESDGGTAAAVVDGATPEPDLAEPVDLSPLPDLTTVDPPDEGEEP